MTPKACCLAAVLSIGLLSFAPLRGAAPLEGSPFSRLVADLAGKAPASDITAGNRVGLLSQGYEALLLRIHLIRSATRSIEIQTFIWTNDACGRLLIHELVEAARRGVKVRIIADHLFSDQDAEIVAFLASVHPNFEVRHYRPPASRLKPSFWRTALAGIRSFRALNQRMHSKVMIFDGSVLITGGRNVEDTYFNHSTGLNFRDRDIVAAGPLVSTAAAQFEQFWSYRHTVRSRDLTDVRAALEKGTFARYNRREDYDFGGHFGELDREARDPALVQERFCSRMRRVQKAVFVYDAPGKSRRASRTAAQTTRDLAAVLNEARSSVVMQTPYLVLSPTARDLLLQLRRRTPAVQIRVSTNSFASTDNLYAYSANYRLRNDYVQALGLAIYEYRPHPADLTRHFPTYADMYDIARRRAVAGGSIKSPFLSLHAKSLVVDDAVAFVGSFNLDPRSENLNTEVGVLVTDAAFARELRQEIERDMLPENSWVIARRRFPLRLEVVNQVVEGILSISPLDVWPIQNTSSFELMPGQTAVPPDHAAFHERYREVGSFPGLDAGLSQREILTRLFKAVGAPLTPIL